MYYEERIINGQLHYKNHKGVKSGIRNVFERLPWKGKIYKSLSQNPVPSWGFNCKGDIINHEHNN